MGLTLQGTGQTTNWREFHGSSEMKSQGVRLSKREEGQEWGDKLRQTWVFNE